MKEDIETKQESAVETEASEKKEAEDMPPAYDEANALTSGEPNVKIAAKNEETKIDMGKEKEAFEGLTKEELMKYANDPFWVRLRWILFIVFWIIWVAMLVASIVIIIYAPKCPSPEPKDWWQKNVMYKVDVKEYADGKLNGLKDNLDLLVESGVGTVYITSLFQTDGTSNGVVDFKSVDSELGSLEDWKALVSALKDRDQKVVIEFNPLYTSNKHMWYEEKTSGNSKYMNYYQDSSNNLNLESGDVVAELGNVLDFWLDTGVDGFYIQKMESLFASDRTGREDILNKFKKVLETKSEETGVSNIFLSEAGSVATKQAVKNGDISLPIYNSGLAAGSALAFKNELDNFFTSFPNTTWPGLAFNPTSSGNGFMVDAMCMLKMMLPGTPIVNSGQELGLDSWDATEIKEQKDAIIDPKKESHLEVFSLLANKMRHQESILFGEISKNTTFTKGDVFGLTRVKKGNPGYLLLVNFGDSEASVNVTDVKTIPDNVRLMARSVSLEQKQEAEETTRFDSDKVLMKANEGRVFTFVPKF